MDGKKKTVDSFVGADGNKRLTFEVMSASGAKQNIKKEQTFKKLPDNDNLAGRNSDRNLLDLSGIVRLPAKNGNELEIEKPIGGRKSTYGSDESAKAAREDFLSSESPDKMDELGRKGALDFLNETADDDMPTRLSGQNQDQNRDRNQGRKRENTAWDDDFLDDDKKPETHQSNSDRFKMGIEDGSGKRVLWQVIAVIGIIVTVVLASYVLFRIFYSAPEPASVNDNESSKVVKDDDADKADEQTETIEPPVVTEETTANVAVYNAGTVEGAAAKLAEKLNTLSMQAEAIGNLTYSGSGYVVLDLTGDKPQATEKLASELNTTVTKINTEDLPSGVVSDKDFVVIICD